MVFRLSGSCEHHCSLQILRRCLAKLQQANIYSEYSLELDLRQKLFLVWQQVRHVFGPIGQHK